MSRNHPYGHCITCGAAYGINEGPFGECSSCSREREAEIKKKERALSAFSGIDEIPEAGAVKELVEAMDNIKILVDSWEKYQPMAVTADHHIKRIGEVAVRALAKFGGAKNDQP